MCTQINIDGGALLGLLGIKPKLRYNPLAIILNKFLINISGRLLQIVGTIISGKLLLF